MKQKTVELPKSLRIGFNTYTVIKWDKDVAAALGMFGQIDFIAQEIYVDTSHGAVTAVNTLIHEVLHGVFEVMGVNETKDWQEEYLVTMQSNCLTQVFLDNPELLEFITRSLHGNN